MFLIGFAMGGLVGIISAGYLAWLIFVKAEKGEEIIISKDRKF